MRIIRGLIVFIFLFSVASSGAVWAKQSKLKKSWITARSFAVIDIDNGRLLYAKKPYLRLPVASTVKVMTALVVLEQADFDKPIVISETAAGVQPSKAYLTQGASYSVYDLLQALLISSANDAAIALAEAVAGSEENFVVLMNKKAKAMGLANTYFANASGLPDAAQQYSTAYDLTKLMRYAVKDPIFDKIISKKAAVIKGSDGRRLYLKNHNKLLRTNPCFVIGKTGYTLKAKHCFVGADHASRKNIVFAILYSRNPWQDIRRLTVHGLRLEDKNYRRAKKKR